MSINQLSPVIHTAENTIIDAEVSLEINNNTLYTFSNSDILIINLWAADGLKYAGFDFTTGTIAPMLSTPIDWVWEGADCARGAFIPAPEKRYRVAIEIAFSTYVCTVQTVTILD